MTLTITHNKVATLPDQPGSEVNKAEWNDTHAIAGDLSGYTITASQISNATITAGSSVSGTNTGDQNLAPYLTSATAASTYVPQTTTVNGQALSGNITITNISGNAATVTTNANLTGPITSVGNATSIASQTGTGTTFAMSASPTFTGTVNNAGEIITSTSANALNVGANGSTNPVFNVNSNTASVATGISVVGAAAGSGVSINASSSGSSEGMMIQTKGGGTLTLNAGLGGSGNIVFQSNGNTVYALGNGASTQTFTLGPFSNSAVTPRFNVVGNADTTLTASTEAPSTYFNLGQTRQHATGSLTLQRDFRISGSTHSFVGASTATDVAALAIDGFGRAGTNATITNAHGILIPTQAVAGTVTNAYGINVVAPTGAGTLNQAALFTGDVGLTSGNFLVNTAGKGLSIKSGSNARIGTGTLTAGTVTIANTSVTANTRVFLQDTTSGGLTNVGVLTAVTTAGTGFVVTSTLALDTSTFNWLLVESA